MARSLRAFTLEGYSHSTSSQVLSFKFGTQSYGHLSRHILSSKIPVELTVLCRLLELVVGSFIMASALKMKRSFHGATLPRSWILENLQKLHRVHNKDAHISVAWGITKPFQDLLERIYSGNDAGEPSIWDTSLNRSTRSDHLLYQNRPLRDAHLRVRNFALARLYVLHGHGHSWSELADACTIHRCRTLCLREL
jgi:hypothetical protein